MNNNKRNNRKDVLKTRGFYVSLMAGTLCVVALAAVYMGKYDNNVDKGRGMVNENLEEIDLAANDEESNEDNEITEVMPEATAEATPDVTIKEEPSITPEATKQPKEKEQKDKKPKGVAVMKSGEGIKNLSFNQEEGIKWPVEGDVLMNYSAEATVYHKTLGAYKANPALIISAKEGTSVCSGTDCVVTNVGSNEEIGKYVETSIGDDYKITYGQLDNVQVEKGAELKEGQIIGTIAAPTKYYVDEGSNLYLKMMCGEDTVDPLIFLR